MWLGTPLLSVPPGMVLIMFDGLHDIDWASMEHAYGSAEEVPALLTALRSPDAGERHKALDRFYGAVHHQGSVYPPTAASLPFLFELAADGATPDRADAPQEHATVSSTEARPPALRPSACRLPIRAVLDHDVVEQHSVTTGSATAGRRAPPAPPVPSGDDRTTQRMTNRPLKPPVQPSGSGLRRR